MRARGLWLAALAAVTTGWGAAPARANARLETEEQRISRILQDALVAHGAEVHRCFEKALADTMEVGGKIDLAVDVGEGGKVTKAGPARDEAGSPVLLACLETSAATWSFAGIDPGSTVIVPLDFDQQAAQFTIKAADAPEHGPGAKGAKAPRGKPGVSPSAPPPFSVKLLVDEKTMHARQASLSLLTVAPASRIAMHKHPVAEILYVLKGHARILSQPGTPPERLDEGMAMFIPIGAPHVIENMGRQSPAEILVYFVPMGPERVFRDPKDPQGRAGFEVIHGTGDAGGPASGAAAPVKWTVATAAKVDPIPIGNGKVRVRKLLTPENTGHTTAYLGILEADPGAQIPRHLHPLSAEISYVVTGGGVLTVGAESFPFGPDTAYHVPENSPNLTAFNTPDKTIMIQLFAPAGPEQRYLDVKGPPKGAATPPGGKP
ncbi:MAG TPA: cupin domain-containing protein [Polyangia bacterium]|nr:cupin domain-containing protein [Polyangia bacterium]